MSSQPRLTFAIPFYTRDQVGLDYLELTLRSVLDQTEQNWVAFVNDDCSPFAGAEALVQRLRDPRVQYFRNTENLGQAGNWNACIARTETEYLTLLHADDLLELTYAESMVALMDANPTADAAFCGVETIDAQGNRVTTVVDVVKSVFFSKGVNSLHGENGLATVMKGNFVFCPTMIYRTLGAKSVPFGVQWRTIPDWSHWADMLFAGQTIIGTPAKYFKYRRHEASGTGVERKQLRLFQEEAEFCLGVAKRAKSKGWDRAAQVSNAMRVVRARLVFFALSDLVSSRPQAAVDKLKYAFDLGR